VIALYWAFQVIFEGVRGDSYTGDIGLDDVSFTPGCKAYGGNLPVAPPPTPTAQPATTSPHQCSSAEFNCAKQGPAACILSTQVTSLLTSHIYNCRWSSCWVSSSPITVEPRTQKRS